MYCSKLTQYLPYGTNQQPPPVSLCLACLSTKHWNAKNCDHMSNIFYKSQLCPITNKHYLMCKGCAHHLPAIKYMSDHHEPSLGYKNFTLMKQCFGDDVFRTIILPAMPAKPAKLHKIRLLTTSLQGTLHALTSMCKNSVSVCVISQSH